MLQVLLSFGIPGTVIWLCRYLYGQIGAPGVFVRADGRYALLGVFLNRVGARQHSLEYSLTCKSTYLAIVEVG